MNNRKFKMTFLERLKDLQLPADQFVVIGSGLLDVLEIRQSNDIDIVVSEELLARLPLMGWEPREKRGETYYEKGECEAWDNWDGADTSPNFAELMADDNCIGGYNFVSLERIYDWKFRTRRPKDLDDLKLIEAYRNRD